MTQGVRYGCKDDFFSLKNERSFYWAGFIAADGCVRLKKSKYSVIKQLEINLSYRDYEQLESFKQDLVAENPIRKVIVGGTEHAHITISSAQIFDDLARFNIIPKKTSSHRFPDWLAGDSLVRHFMRGYFDGDGGFYLNQANQMTIRICGTIDFLKTYKDILELGSGIKSISQPYIHNGQGALNYSGNIICSKIVSFLYDNSNVYMERKFLQSKSVNQLIRRKNRPSKEVLEQAYRELKSTAKVGERLGYSQQGISNMMRDYDLGHIYKEVRNGR